MSEQPTDAGVIIAGFTFDYRSPETVRNHMRVRPPGRLKKPESIQAWWDDAEAVETAWREQLAVLRVSKATAAATRVVAIDIRGGADQDNVFDTSGPLPLEFSDSQLSPSGLFVQWLLGRYPGAFPTYPRSAGRVRNVAIYGFDAKVLVRITGVAAMYDGLHPPLGYWYQNDDVFDPKEMLLETEVKQLIPLHKLLADAPRLYPEDPGPLELIDESYRPHANPVLDVAVVTELCSRYRLLPEPEYEAVLPQDTSSWAVVRAALAVEADTRKQAAEDGPAVADEDESEEDPPKNKRAKVQRPTKKARAGTK